MSVEHFINQQHSLVSTLTTNLANVPSMVKQLSKISDSLGDEILISKKLLTNVFIY